MPNWRDEIFAALKAAEIRQVGYVPDAGHARLIELCHDDPEICAVPLTTEEEGVALAAGAWLGGQRAALLMQSSGVGNCINMLNGPSSTRGRRLFVKRSDQYQYSKPCRQRQSEKSCRRCFWKIKTFSTRNTPGEADYGLLLMERMELREILTITNPNKGWVFNKLDDLRREWEQWLETVP
jgi:hypothetical protein